jgi:hypothetical protein
VHNENLQDKAHTSRKKIVPINEKGYSNDKKRHVIQKIGVDVKKWV